MILYAIVKVYEPFLVLELLDSRCVVDDRNRLRVKDDDGDVHAGAARTEVANCRLSLIFGYQ